MPGQERSEAGHGSHSILKSRDTVKYEVNEVVSVYSMHSGFLNCLQIYFTLKCK